MAKVELSYHFCNQEAEVCSPIGDSRWWPRPKDPLRNVGACNSLVIDFHDFWLRSDEVAQGVGDHAAAAARQFSRQVRCKHPIAAFLILIQYVRSSGFSFFILRASDLRLLEKATGHGFCRYLSRWTISRVAQTTVCARPSEANPFLSLGKIKSQEAPWFGRVAMRHHVIQGCDELVSGCCRIRSDEGFSCCWDFGTRCTCPLYT